MSLRKGSVRNLNVSQQKTYTAFNYNPGQAELHYSSSRNLNQTHNKEKNLLVHLSPDFRAVGSILIHCPGTQARSRISKGIREGQPGSCWPKTSSSTSSVQDKSTRFSLKNLTFSSHMNYGKKLLKVRFHYAHPRASSCVRLGFFKNTLGSQCPVWELCFCSLSAILHSLLTSPSVAVLAALGQAGTPRWPRGHRALGQAWQVTQLGAGRGRTLAKLPIDWSGN